ncbi:MAG: NYN domain-containing protein [Actinomycetota bacterium]|nr:NYN domain-containing protein [Actinomycetota bacterium]
MSGAYCGFIDVGYLRGQGGKACGIKPGQVQLQAHACVTWLQTVLPSQAVGLAGLSFLRAYWYDGALEADHSEASAQRHVLDGIAFTPGVQLRLGHLAERRNRLQHPVERAMRSTANELEIDSDDLLAAFNRHWTWRPDRRQKGVDTLITLDLVRLAQRSVFRTAVLLAGDRDLAEPVRTAQDAGCQVIVATIGGQASLAKELAQLADEVIEIPQDNLKLMVTGP